MSERQDHPPPQNDDLLSVSRLPVGEELRFSAPPPQIEGYQILEKLGEAGQGQVWRAVQQTTGCQVALKVPRIGLLSSKKTLARFEREVEIIAQLKHLHIARIIDSGVHRGLYYYAMDLIEGKHLDQYVKDKGLSLRQILELMKVVCDAVQHAHQNGVIHRDLKPSNIIVTQEGHPCVVDFGLAKSLAGSEGAVTISMEGETAGTPAYMSPEQAAGHKEQIDIRTDVYSLGAILFMLLTGRNPHDLSGSHFDVLHRISEEEVRRPRRLDPKIDRDLEALLLKALERDPERRYSSAAGLAEDIDSYLNGLPLHATPRLRMSRVRSFARRHRVGVILCLVVSISVVIGVITLAAGTIIIFQEKQRTQKALEREGQALNQEKQARVEAERARATEEQARTEAQRQARIAQAVTDFMNKDFLASVGPLKDGGRQMTVHQVLDLASRKIEGRFRGEPLIEAAVRQTLGDIYIRLANYVEAVRQLERVRHIHQEYLGEEDPSAIQSMGSLGNAYANLGRYPEAEPLLRRSLELARRVLGEKSIVMVDQMNSLANLCSRQGHYEEAESLHLQALAIQTQAWGAEHRYTLDMIQSIAAFYGRHRQYEKAERLCGQVLEIEDRLYGEDHPYTLRTRGNLGILFENHGQYEKAEQLLFKTRQAMHRVLGDEHPDTLISMYNLALVYWRQNRYPEAEAMYEETLETQRRVLGDEHQATLSSARDLASVYSTQARYDEAEALYRQTVETSTRALGTEHPDTLETVRLLTALYEAWGKPQEAQQWRARLPADSAERTSLSTISEENPRIPDDSQAHEEPSGPTEKATTTEMEAKIQDLLCTEPRKGVNASKQRGAQSPKVDAPSPANGSDVGPRLWTELRWMPEQDAVAYRVHFGTDPQTLVLVGEVRNINGIDSPELQRTRWYCWRVDVIRSDDSVVEGRPCSFSTGNMVGWWRFDESEGRVAIDSSGYDNNGELMGNPQWQPGRIEGALEFDGQDDYVCIKHRPQLNITEEITLAAWIKVNVFDRNHQTIISKGDMIGRLQRDKSRDAIQFGAAGTLRGQRAVGDGKWHHIVGICDGTMLSLYVDGTLDTSVGAAGKIKVNDYDVLIGDNAQMPGRFWNGLIDDVRMYSYALTPGEIHALYAGGGPDPLARPRWVTEETKK